MITSNEVSFDQTVRFLRIATQSGFSDFADFVRTSKISQDNHYVKSLLYLCKLNNTQEHKTDFN